MTRKRMLVSLGILLTAAVLGYAALIEPNHIHVTRLIIGESRLSQALSGRKIALLSDLHFGPGAEPAAEEALRVLGEIRPDLILLAGDYVKWGSRTAAYERALDFFARLDAPLGVYAILGDADRTSSRNSCKFCHEPGSGAPTRRHRVAFLKNATSLIDLPNGGVRITGLDPVFPTSDVLSLRALLAGDTPTILLSHSSRVYKDIDASLDVLTLSGDTHGGQVWLPRWFWRLTRLKPDPKHIHGFFHDGRKSLVVTRGVGTSHVRIRLGAPPEIVVLEFSKGAQ